MRKAPLYYLIDPVFDGLKIGLLDSYVIARVTNIISGRQWNRPHALATDSVNQVANQSIADLILPNPQIQALSLATGFLTGAIIGVIHSVGAELTCYKEYFKSLF